MCSEGHYSTSSINIDLSLSSNPLVPFKFVPVIFFTAKDSIRGHILHFSCYNSLAFFRLQNSLIFPWLSWLWHYQRVLPVILYQSWLILDDECWLCSVHEFCKQVDLLLIWLSRDYLYHGNAINQGSECSPYRELVGNHLPAHCWWMFLSSEFCLLMIWFRHVFLTGSLQINFSPSHCIPSDDAWFQFFPVLGILSNFVHLVQVVSVRSLHCKITHFTHTPPWL